jgi:polysaccharide export outer membrane protein
LQTALEKRLTDNVRNPSVLVRLLQFNVNVLGEVRTPGTQKFLVDRVTIIDALSSAGDLTDFGKREDVMVIREEEGKKIYHSVDLRSKTLFQSPAYFLQPNDIVYVAPNKNKLKTIDMDTDAQRKTGLVLSVISLVVGIGSIIVFSFR